MSRVFLFTHWGGETDSWLVTAIDLTANQTRPSLSDWWWWCEIGGGKLSSRMPPLKASGEGSNCAAVFPPLLRTINSEWAFEHSARSSHLPLRGSHPPTLLSISLNDLSRRFLAECNSSDRHLVANGGFLILRLARCVYLHRNSCSTASEVTCTMVSHKISLVLPFFLIACKSNIYELRLSVVLWPFPQDMQRAIYKCGMVSSLLASSNWKMQLGISDMLDRNARFGYCCKKETT